MSAVPDGVDGLRCRRCGQATLLPTRRCPECSGTVEAARLGPGGTVWSHTVVRIAYGGRTPPYRLAYVDLDGGGRLLAHLAPAAAIGVGDRVRLAGTTPDGDPLVEAAP